LIGGETEVLSIFSNLVFNAVRYTPPGGVIRVLWEKDGDQALFSVADTGIGIAAKDLPRLTERFYRADVGRSRASGGTGLGLSIVKHALESHQAALHIDSELGVGSTFSCRFPEERTRVLVKPTQTGVVEHK
jgi:two-component system phosphate regulon sensor histidine kinase PhoR